MNGKHERRRKSTPERPKMNEHAKPIRPKHKLSKVSKVSRESIHGAKGISRMVFGRLCHRLPMVVAPMASSKVNTDHLQLAWFIHRKATARYTTNNNT